MAESVIFAHLVTRDELTDAVHQEMVDAVSRTLLRFARKPGLGVAVHCVYTGEVDKGTYHEDEILPGLTLPAPPGT